MKIKRIIEIEEEDYKALSELSEREKVNELSYYEKIIAQSTPYNPTEDSAFKEEVIRMVNMGVYPEAIVEWVRENGGE